MGYKPRGFNPAKPGPIGGTTPAAITGTTLKVGDGSSTVPTIFGSDPAAGISFEPAGSKGVYIVANNVNVAGFFGNGQVTFNFAAANTFGSTTCAFTISGHTNNGLYFDLAAVEPGLAVGGNSIILAKSTGLVIASGLTLTLGNAYVNTPSVSTGYLLVSDNTGTVYEIPAKAH